MMLAENGDADGLKKFSEFELELGQSSGWLTLAICKSRKITASHWLWIFYSL